MSNVNNWQFAKHLDNFKAKMLDPQIKRVEEANAIMQDEKHVWADDSQKNSAVAKQASYKAWLQFYQQFYDEGMKMVKQHEGLVDKVAKVYDSWYQNISNEGKQEVELMSSQADLLNELMGELYKELLPLNLPGMKPPQGMNL